MDGLVDSLPVGLITKENQRKNADKGDIMTYSCLVFSKLFGASTQFSAVGLRVSKSRRENIYSP